MWQNISENIKRHSAMIIALSVICGISCSLCIILAYNVQQHFEIEVMIRSVLEIIGLGTVYFTLMAALFGKWV